MPSARVRQPPCTPTRDRELTSPQVISRAKLLVVCEPGGERASAEWSSGGLEAEFVCRTDEAIERARSREHLAIVLCDDPRRTRIEAFLGAVDDVSPVIGAVRQGDVARGVLAMRLGAQMVIEIRPSQPLPSAAAVTSALAELGLDAREEGETDPLEAIVRAPDSPLNGLLDILGPIARSDASVLITGESGVGKDLFARAIHEASPRRAEAFVSVNCGAIAPELIEVELFGAKKGAYTGAHQERDGVFAAADRGTIFLDEVGELPATAQVTLLRVLQEKRITPVGASASIPIDFRVIAATNRQLEEDLVRGVFREDLFYRLSVLPLEIPALRDRPQDITPLCAHFIARHNARHGTEIVGATAEARGIMKRYAWPGNVRELTNLIERICVIKRTGFIEREDLTEEMLGTPAPPIFGLDVPSEGIDMTQTLDRLERKLLSGALRKAEGNKARAARLLGLNRTTLVEKLKRKRIDLDDP